MEGKKMFTWRDLSCREAASCSLFNFEAASCSLEIAAACSAFSFSKASLSLCVAWSLSCWSLLRVSLCWAEICSAAASASLFTLADSCSAVLRALSISYKEKSSLSICWNLDQGCGKAWCLYVNKWSTSFKWRRDIARWTRAKRL